MLAKSLASALLLAAALATTANAQCVSHEMCQMDSPGTYCDRYGECFGCNAQVNGSPDPSGSGGCWRWKDAFDNETPGQYNDEFDCPEQCRVEELECQWDLHCGFNEYCTNSYMCKSCDDCQNTDGAYGIPCAPWCETFVGQTAPSTQSTAATTAGPTSAATTRPFMCADASDEEVMAELFLPNCASLQPDCQNEFVGERIRRLCPVTCDACAEFSTAPASTTASTATTTTTGASVTMSDAASTTTSTTTDEATTTTAEVTTSTSTTTTSNSGAGSTLGPVTTTTTTSTMPTTSTSTTTEATISCDVRGCFSCETSNVCSVCKNGNFLLNGQCLAQCPNGYTTAGFGNFNKRCVPRCSVGRNNCHTCTADNLHCTVCSNGQYLVDGMCVASCPADLYIPTGLGSFNRVCLSRYACDILGCHTCDETTGQCLSCRNELFLHEGSNSCVSQCPPSYTGVGFGSFNRRCERFCSMEPKYNCYRCDGDACAVCKNGAFLYQGVCVAACPEGTMAAGAGNFNKRCLPL